MVRTIGVAMLLLGVGLSGCIVKEVRVGDENDECATDLDCDELGYDYRWACDGGACRPKSVDPTWGCLGEPAPRGTGRPVTIQLKVVNPINGNAPKVNANVRACSLLDADCAQPLVEAQSDTSGDARLQLTDDFTGYFEIISPSADEADPEVPVMAFLPPREIIRGAAGRVIFTFTQRNAQTIVSFAGGAFPPNADSNFSGGPFNAWLWGTMLDCQSNLAAGASFELLTTGQKSDETKSFYNNMNLPDLLRTQTDASGTFGLTNLNAGSVSFKSIVNESQQPLASDARAFVRDGWVTQLFIAP